MGKTTTIIISRHLKMGRNETDIASNSCGAEGVWS